MTQPTTGNLHHTRPSVPAVQSLERAARILLAFTAETPEINLSDLARFVNLSKSTTRRLLLTLEELELVKSDPSSQMFKLGPTCMRLGYVAHLSLDVRSIARPVLEQLVKDARETAYLFVRVGDSGVCVDIVEAFREIRILHTAVGTVFPLHAGAATRALLEDLSDQQIRDYVSKGLKRYTPNTLVEADDLIADAKKNLANGFVLSMEDLVQGTAGIGSVVRNHEGAIAGAISIGGLKDRFAGAEQSRLIERVQLAAEQISGLLGYAKKQRIGPAPSGSP